MGRAACATPAAVLRTAATKSSRVHHRFLPIYDVRSKAASIATAARPSHATTTKPRIACGSPPARLATPRPQPPLSSSCSAYMLLLVMLWLAPPKSRTPSVGPMARFSGFGHTSSCPAQYQVNALLVGAATIDLGDHGVRRAAAPFCQWQQCGRERYCRFWPGGRVGLTVQQAFGQLVLAIRHHTAATLNRSHSASSCRPAKRTALAFSSADRLKIAQATPLFICRDT